MHLKSSPTERHLRQMIKSIWTWLMDMLPEKHIWTQSIILFLHPDIILPRTEQSTPRCPVLVAKMRYYARFKKRIHLNPPIDLNEKILWQEIFADTSLWTRCADKYEVRKYVEECGLNEVLVPYYGVWAKAGDVDFDSLPLSFALKGTSGSGGNLFRECEVMS